ncbi:MAG TPA: MFS transporter [Blastocatellia bacterium]|nr:MFS transporter [Blastocatellia bacterium]HMZ19869.1 MFS transporter [Blastocatellia bacterium]HNG30260.1 MFS transporter [Blastocatellia bacterium]
MAQATTQQNKEGLAMPPVYRQVRWWILALLFGVTVLNFVDRQALAVLGSDITKEFNLSNTAFGTIGAVFRAGMMVGEFPMGWLMDRAGVRFGLAFAVLWWSVGNGLHSIAASMQQFRFFRFWLGTGECGNYSGGNKIVASWFPVRERAFAIGVFNSASMLGAFIAAYLIIPIRETYGWRMGFLVPSALGLLWASAWWLIYRQPKDHPYLTEAERRHINSDQDVEAAASEPAPTNRQLLRLPQTWGLMLCRFWVGAVVDFYLLWMPKYFHDVRGLSVKESAYFNSVTFIFGDLGSIGGGIAAAWLLKKGLEVKSARRSTLLFGAALCLLSFVVPLTGSVPMAIAMISLVLLGHTFLSANMFASISDVFPNSAVARVTGLTGVANGVSGLIFPIVTGVIVDRFSYLPVFFMAGAMPLLGVAIALWTLKNYQRVKLP